jgi:hypothetical protein
LNSIGRVEAKMNKGNTDFSEERLMVSSKSGRLKLVWKKNTTTLLEYAESIINTGREPSIVPDQDLREVTKEKSAKTLGQLLYDLGNKRWDIPKLRDLLETILPLTKYPKMSLPHA